MLVKEIIETHQGQVWVESEVGKGSTFFFTLPFVTEAEQTIAAPAAEPAVTTSQVVTNGAGDILLVEDDHTYARLLQEHFASAGLTVTVMSRAAEALEMARHTTPRLVLTDIHLAGRMDGWDLLVALKDDPLLRSIPVLIISTNAEANVRGLALAGADYLLKPVLSGRLLHAIQQRLPTLAGKRVLLVEDDADCRQHMRTVLAAGGMEVEEAINGQEALVRMAQWIPDLLVLDLLMPEIDGVEVLRQLRADKRAMNLPVLVVTGKDLTPHEKTYIKHGLATLVSKQEARLDYFTRVVGQILAKN